MNVIDMNAPAKRDEVIDLVKLPYDYKRMLRVQWKEFLHWIEDYEMAKNAKRFGNNGDDHDDCSYRHAA